MGKSTEPLQTAPTAHPGITIATKKHNNSLFDTTRPGVKYTASSPTIEQAEALRRLKQARTAGVKIDDPIGVDSSADAGYGKGL